MDYFENTTRITEDGYAAILQMQKKQHCIICRAIGILLAIPFLERLIYRGILLGIGDTADFHLGFLDFFFLLLLAAALQHNKTDFTNVLPTTLSLTPDRKNHFY